MNWLRRLIPWAFKHDWKANSCGKDMQWDPDTGKLHNFLICLRCGCRSESFDISDRGKFLKVQIRGCRGPKHLDTKTREELVRRMMRNADHFGRKRR